MADKSDFVIQDLLKPLSCEVVTPSFLSSKKQFQRMLSKRAKRFTTSEYILNGPLGELRSFIL